MNHTSKIGLLTLLGLGGLVLVGKIFNNNSLQVPFFDLTQTFNFEFDKESVKESAGLKQIVEDNLEGKEGVYAVYIEQQPASPSAIITEDGEYYARLQDEQFPSASLYKLFLMAAVLKEVEKGTIGLDENISATKTDLSRIYGGVDYGYEQAPETIVYTTDEALIRIGRVSDNFASIMLNIRLSKISKGESQKGLLAQIAGELGMKGTDFSSDPVQTTAFDIGRFFKLLYLNQVVSEEVSQQIIKYLSLSQLNNRIPANLPEDTKVVHKTGELSRVRHDAGIVYLDKNPYVLVILSKDLPDETAGIKILADLSRDIFNYFDKLNSSM